MTILSTLGFALTGLPLSAAQDEAATTRHEVEVDGRALSYTAFVDRLPIRGLEADKPRAYIAFVAYRMPAEPGAGPRPVTFIWGGGPGSSGLGVHMNWGPKRVVDGDLEDNGLTLLGETDLVFVDPVGTGFSRPARSEYADEFYSVRGDARSIAEFVRVWLRVYGEGPSPLFLAGVSYGVWRAVSVAERLEQDGTQVAGLVLASGGMGLGTEVAPREIVEAHRIPGRTATALHHGQLPEEIAATRSEALVAGEQWALDVYAPALRRIASLTDEEREAVARDLARFTGYPPERIDRRTLRITPREYLQGMLMEEGRSLEQYDMRQTRPSGSGSIPSSSTDVGIDDQRRMQYLRHDLAYRTDLAYLGVESGYTPIMGPEPSSVGQRWSYDSGSITPEVVEAAQAGEGPPGAEPWLLRAIEQNPQLGALFGVGLFDSLNSCSGNQELRDRLDPAVAQNIQLKCYVGGHGFHREEAPSRQQFAVDIRTFIQNTAGGR